MARKITSVATGILFMAAIVVWIEALRQGIFSWMLLALFSTAAMFVGNEVDKKYQLHSLPGLSPATRLQLWLCRSLTVRIAAVAITAGLWLPWLRMNETWVAIAWAVISWSGDVLYHWLVNSVVYPITLGSLVLVTVAIYLLLDKHDGRKPASK